MLDDETSFGGVPMGNPQDPADHPVNNLAAKDALPLQNSGQSFAQEALDQAAKAPHTGALKKSKGKSKKK